MSLIERAAKAVEDARAAARHAKENEVRLEIRKLSEKLVELGVDQGAQRNPENVDGIWLGTRRQSEHSREFDLYLHPICTGCQQKFEGPKIESLLGLGNELERLHQEDAVCPECHNRGAVSD